MGPVAVRPPLPGGPFLVVGLARSGQSAATVLAERGAAVIALDRGTPDDVDVPDAVEVVLDSDGIELLDRVRAVICSPGVPAQAAVLRVARERGIPVLGELELGWRLTPVPVIAITGTNGKTTTAELLGHVLRSAGRTPAVVGNVGVPYSSLARAGSTPCDVVVCEVSSFQLEAAPAFAPDIGILLNLASDHLDRHGSVAAYHEMKLSLFARQEAPALAVVPVDLESARIPGSARRVTFGSRSDADLRITPDALIWQGDTLIATADLGLPGPHNAENAAAAAVAALSWGIEPGPVAAALSSFEGVPHRLQPVAEQGGVLWVNDSKATNVAAAVVALRSFSDRPVHVILGGTGKGEDYGPLREPLSAYARHAYVIGEEAGAIAAAIDDVVAVTRSGTLAAAVAAAREASAAGDVILLAPACASYDQFRDFEHRGQVFTDMARTAI